MFRLEKLASKPQDVRRRSIYQHESVLEVSHVASDEFPFMKFSLSCKVFYRESERKMRTGMLCEWYHDWWEQSSCMQGFGLVLEAGPLHAPASAPKNFCFPARTSLSTRMYAEVFWVWRSFIQGFGRAYKIRLKELSLVLRSDHRTHFQK